jgi:branched-chain amino acid transport system permease protein
MTGQELIDALSLGSEFALLALGVALVFGILGLINFAHGELIMVAGYTCIVLSSWSQPLVIAVTFVTVVVCAVLMERVAFRPIRGAEPSTLLITSFALSSFLQGLALAIEGARPKSIDILGGLSSTIDVASISLRWIDVATVGATAVCLAAVAWALARTDIGLQMRAAAEDFEMARALGVRADRVISAAFAVSGALAAVAAILLIAQSGTVSPKMGLTPVLVAFVAAVVGGLGRLWAAPLGGFVLGFLTVGLENHLPDSLLEFQDAFVFGAVILILLVRPHGIAGDRMAVRV